MLPAAPVRKEMPAPIRPEISGRSKKETIDDAESTRTQIHNRTFRSFWHLLEGNKKLLVPGAVVGKDYRSTASQERGGGHDGGVRGPQRSGFQGRVDSGLNASADHETRSDVKTLNNQRPVH